MKRETYMSKTDLFDFLKIGVLAAEAADIAKRTPEKDWSKKLKTVSTYCSNIVDERLACLDKKQLFSVARRKDHTELMLYTSDQRRLNKANDNTVGGDVTISIDDFYVLADLALLECRTCKQGDVCTNCPLRPLYHRVGVMPLRTDVGEGQCEFRSDDEPSVLTPQYGLAERI